MIDRNHIGLEMPTHSVEVEKGRLRFFAKATGQADTVYTDEDVAKKAGFESLPVPPTFLFCLDMDTPDPFEVFKRLDVDIANILHGIQTFKFVSPACAGDTLTFRSRVEDIYEKKGGALEFIVQKTDVTNQHGDPVAELTRTIVVRN